MPDFRFLGPTARGLCAAVLFGLPTLTLPVHAQGDDTAVEEAGMTLEQVEEAYLSGDLVAARTGLVPFAEAGDATAQYRLGFMLANSEGGPADRDGAIRWLEAALAQDKQPARMLLARVYLSGAPEVPDYVRAAELLQIEVEDGGAEAHFYLAQLLRAGRGVEADPEQAATLLDIAARSGHLPSQFALAQMYSRGEGLEKDAAQAARWLFEAAEGDYGPAQMSLYRNYAEGLGFPADPEKALEWLKRAAGDGYTEAEQVLGSNYLLGGGGVEADPVRGVSYLVRAAEKGDRQAQTNLGYAYATGTGVPEDFGKAFVWYKAAADQGLVRAAVAVGSLYEQGSGTEVNLDEAVKYYLFADKGGNDLAAQALGRLVVTGDVDPEISPEAAVRWVAQVANAGSEEGVAWLLSRSAEGDTLADYLLGVLYSQSEGVPRNPDEAVRHMRIAAEAGVVPAQVTLGRFFAEGFGVDQSLVQAHVWTNIAAANGSDAAADKRDAYAALMTPEQIAEAQDRARGRLNRESK